MDSYDSFKQAILGHFKNMSADKVPLNLLDSLCDKITDYYFDQYSRFRKQHPKSIKRYSTFQLKDIEHPQTKKMVVDFLKIEISDKYRDYSKILLSMTVKELNDLEQWWQDFERL
ncbi:MAG TPA: hypothetical protein PKD18_14425 [Saprospiraceae bacterium]|nr:hypothetical protein [Saprospiraceae bacterium]